MDIDSRLALLQKKYFIWAVVFILTLLIGAGAYQFSESDFALLKSRYNDTSKFQLLHKADEIEDVFESIYVTLRTIGVLPFVSSLDLTSGELGEKNKEIIRKVYQNSFRKSHISEIYIVTKHFDPKVFAKGEDHPVGLIEFDDEIVGEHDGEVYQKGEESFEYTELQKQLTYFAKNYAEHRVDQGLEFPGYISDKLITCDARGIVGPKNKSSNLGFVYSVPFYSPEGNFLGVVSAIIRESAIKEVLKDPYFVLSKPAYTWSITGPGIENTLKRDLSLLREGKTSRNYIVSQQYKLDVKTQDEWYLTMTLPDSYYFNLPELESLKEKRIVGRVFLGVLALLIFLGAFIYASQLEVSVLSKKIKALKEKNKELKRNQEP